MQIVYSRQKILKIFESTHAISCVIDPEVDPDLKPTEDLAFSEWIQGMDLIAKPRIQLQHYRNFFSSEITEVEFFRLWNDRRSTLRDLASLISIHSKPRSISDWKFAGKYCEKGTLLKYLISRIQKENQSRINGKTLINQLARQKDWSFVDHIHAVFPGSLPTPISVSHRTMLPFHVRFMEKFLALIAILALVGFVFLLIMKASYWVYLLLTAIIAFTSMVVYQRVLRIPKTTHYIFPGIRSIRELVERHSSHDISNETTN